MAILPIVTYDDEVLREKATPVKKNSKALQKLIDDMFDTMYNADGVGLAAPQIGESLRLFVADADLQAKEDGTPAYGPLTLINPKITVQSDETVTMEEGCLSIPEVVGPVKRAERIVVEYKDRDFKPQKLEVDTHLARVIQHETDHLDGVLFIDHLSFFKQKLVASKLKALAEGRQEIVYPVVGKVNS